jgi:hypothetical protein
MIKNILILATILSMQVTAQAMEQEAISQDSSYLKLLPIGPLVLTLQYVASTPSNIYALKSFLLSHEELIHNEEFLKALCSSLSSRLNTSYGKIVVRILNIYGTDRAIEILKKNVSMDDEIRKGAQDYFFDALKNSHSASVKFFIRAGISPNTCDFLGSPALVYATWEGNKEMIELLIALQANSNAKNRAGDTALMVAASNGYTDIVQILVNAQGDVNVTNREGQTALIGAASKSNDRIVEILLEHGANVNAQDTHGYTALRSTSSKYTSEILLKAGADLTIKDKYTV